MSSPLRHTFAEFLEELASGDRDPAKWLSLVVNHYFDQRLEEIRRELVRMDIAGHLDAAKLRQWADEYRHSGDF